MVRLFLKLLHLLAFVFSIAGILVGIAALAWHEAGTQPSWNQVFLGVAMWLTGLIVRFIIKAILRSMARAENPPGTEVR